jgi:hypothetical protein
MARVTPDEIRALLAEEDARAQTLQRAGQAVSPRAYISALLDQARAPQQSQQSAPATGPLAASPPTLRAPATPMTPDASASASPSGAAQTSAWRRVELAPGVELHIQTEAEERYQALIARVLAASKDDLGTA